MTVDAEEQTRERNEKFSLRIVGTCFLALSAYIAYESITDLISQKAPEHSIPGIILACVSLIVMPDPFTRKETGGQGTQQRSQECRC